MSENDDGNSFLSGLMIGGVLGAALGVALSGDENRSKLWKKIEEFDFEKAFDKLSNAYDEGSKEAKVITQKIENEEDL
ncbi:MAG: YtxH domain-containing protein [Candidatus Saganbacteria bacterium]|nr:YtxH domain-containing protein [Candidatus Saganbacteria bacterium]